MQKLRTLSSHRVSRYRVHHIKRNRWLCQNIVKVFSFSLRTNLARPHGKYMSHKLIAAHPTMSDKVRAEYLPHQECTKFLDDSFG